MKRFFQVLLTVLFAVGIASQAVAASYPDKPIRLVVPFASGGTVNLMARILAQRLSESLGQQVIVDNRPGAGGTVGADLVAKAAPDGYTLLLAAPSHQSFHHLLYKSLPYDPQKAFTQVALFASVPNVLVVSNKVPARNVRELIAQSRSKRLFMASSGSGGVNHLIGELFQFRTGADFEHVAYKGAGPALNDMLGGTVDLMFGNVPAFLPQIQAGKLRALAVASAKRLPSLPDVPTMAEAGVADLAVDSWSGVLAPGGTPQAVIDRLSTEIIKIANEKSTVDMLAAQGAVPMPGGPIEYAALVRTETQRWVEVIKKANITLD